MAHASATTFLFAKIAEEAGEISQYAGKCIAYGPFNKAPGRDVDNLVKMIGEINQTLAAARMLVRELRDQGYECPDVIQEQAINQESEKLLIGFNTSVKLGMTTYE